MSETIASIRTLRRYAVVDRELRAAHEILGMWRSLAGEFVSCSLQPIVIIDGHIQPRDLRSDIPEELWKQLTEAAQRVAELECELRDAYVAERACA